jgi:dynein light chain 1
MVCLVQKDLTKIEELLFVGNPLWETHTKTEDFRINVAGRIPWLKKLDGVPVDDDEKERGKAIVV